MAARAIWKGSLKIGATTLQVKLYSAVQDRDIHFHVLQQTSRERVKQAMVTEDRQKIERQDIQKGYEVEPGTFVVLENQELEQLKPKESRAIELPRFVRTSELGNEWYERPYYLGPEDGVEPYFALAEALSKRDLLGIARWTMRGKAYVGALRPEGDYLTLIKLRYAEEVLSARDLPAPEGRALDAKELRMAEELVGALEGKFTPSEFRDDYRHRVLEFIEAKAKGKHMRLPAIRKRKAEGSLDEQLAKSIAALRRGKEKKIA